MKSLRCLCLLLAGCSYVHHVPPGQSAAFSMAKKAELVQAPAPPPPVAPASPETMPALEVEEIADSFTLGNFCMEQGRYAEAAVSYERAVKLNPNFADAWNKLAVAYQNLGDEKKALAAFKKFKMASMQ